MNSTMVVRFFYFLLHVCPLSSNLRHFWFQIKLTRTWKDWCLLHCNQSTWTLLELLLWDSKLLFISQLMTNHLYASDSRLQEKLFDVSLVQSHPAPIQFCCQVDSHCCKLSLEIRQWMSHYLRSANIWPWLCCLCGGHMFHENDPQKHLNHGPWKSMWYTSDCYYFFCFLVSGWNY